MAASIARAFPGVPLDWGVQTEFADAVRAHPAVDRVIPFPRRELIGFWKPIGGWRRTAAFLATLCHGYDLAIDAQRLARSGAMAIFSGARTRIGFADAREFGWIGLNRRIRVAPGLPAVERVLLLGATSESAVLDEIARDRADIVSIAGAGTLAMSMAAVRDAAIVIGNDSAMLHAAAGFRDTKSKTLVLFDLALSLYLNLISLTQMSQFARPSRLPFGEYRLLKENHLWEGHKLESDRTGYQERKTPSMSEMGSLFAFTWTRRKDDK